MSYIWTSVESGTCYEQNLLLSTTLHKIFRTKLGIKWIWLGLEKFIPSFEYFSGEITPFLHPNFRFF